MHKNIHWHRACVAHQHRCPTVSVDSEQEERILAAAAPRWVLSGLQHCHSTRIESLSLHTSHSAESSYVAAPGRQHSHATIHCSYSSSGSYASTDTTHGKATPNWLRWARRVFENADMTASRDTTPATSCGTSASMEATAAAAAAAAAPTNGATSDVSVQLPRILSVRRSLDAQLSRCRRSSATNAGLKRQSGKGDTAAPFRTWWTPPGDTTPGGTAGEAAAVPAAMPRSLDKAAWSTLLQEQCVRAEQPRMPSFSFPAVVGNKRLVAAKADAQAAPTVAPGAHNQQQSDGKRAGWWWRLLCISRPQVMDG